MRDWFAHAFGRAADAVGDGIADIRDKLVFESFFQRHLPERKSPNDLGWFQDRPGTAGRAEGDALEQFYDRLSPAERAEYFCEPPEQDRAIER